MKNNILLDSNVAERHEIKAISGENKTKPRAIKLSFSKGMKQRADMRIAEIKIYTKAAKAPVDFIAVFNLVMLVIPNEFKIKNKEIDIAAKKIMIKQIFSHFFIMHCMKIISVLLKKRIYAFCINSWYSLWIISTTSSGVRLLLEITRL